MVNAAKWKQAREREDTDAGIARRMAASGRTFQEVETRVRRELRIRQWFILEALIAHGGNQVHACRAIGVSRTTLNRTMQALGLTGDTARALAKELTGQCEETR